MLFVDDMRIDPDSFCVRIGGIPNAKNISADELVEEGAFAGEGGSNGTDGDDIMFDGFDELKGSVIDEDVAVDGAELVGMGMSHIFVKLKIIINNNGLNF